MSFRRLIEEGDVQSFNNQRKDDPNAVPELSRLTFKHPPALDGIDLSEAKVDRASFSEASLRHASLERAFLRETLFLVSDLDGADFSGADLGGSIIFRCSIKGAKFHGANFNGALIFAEPQDLEEMKRNGALLDKAHINPKVQRLAPVQTAHKAHFTLQ